MFFRGKKYVYRRVEILFLFHRSYVLVCSWQDAMKPTAGRRIGACDPVWIKYEVSVYFSVMSVGRMETVTQLFCLSNTFLTKSWMSLDVSFWMVSS